MKNLALHVVKVTVTILYFLFLPLWWLSTPIRKYFRWFERIIIWRARGDINRRQFARKLGQWWTIGALVQYSSTVVYFGWTGRLHMSDLLNLDMAKLWGLIEEETLLFAMFLPLAFIAAFFVGWCYRRDLLTKLIMKRIREIPDPGER